MTHWTPICGETPIDVSHLKVKGVTNRRELSIVEAGNINEAVYKYLSMPPSRAMAPFTLDWSLELHGEMFCDVWEWAGTLRTRDVSIGIPFAQLTEQLQRLFTDLPEWKTFGIDLLEQSARLHHRAVQIHPFPNGNGRWSRMLGNVWLKLHREPIVEWPDAAIGEVSTIREEYIAAVKAADMGDHSKLIELHYRYRAT